MTAQGSAGGGATTATADAAGGSTPTGAMPDSAQLAEILKGIDKTHVGAAMSKMISASIGDLAMVFARSPQHKHYTFADIEWMILPAVMTGQFYVAELAQKDTGARAPVAAVLWASVSDETDARLTANPSLRIRLRPDEWRAGENVWIVDTAGEAPLIGGALAELAAGPFKDKVVKVAVLSGEGGPRVEMLDALLKRAVDAAKAAKGAA